MLAWLLLLVVWVAPFHFYGLPAERIRVIVANEAFFQAVYVALLVTTVACMVPRVDKIVRRSLSAPAQGSESSAASSGAATLDGSYDQERARLVLESLRFGWVTAGDGWTWGVRRPYSPLGSILFHASFLGVAVGIAVMVALPGFSGSAIVAEGERFIGQLEQYESLETSHEDTAGSLPDVSFDVESIDAEFFEDALLFTRLEAKLRTPSGGRSVRVGHPWLVGATTLVQIEDFGYSLELVDRFDSGNPVESAYKLNAFPSGLQDSFEYKDLSAGSSDVYSIEVAIYGDFAEGDSGPGVESFNLSDPWVDIKVDRVLSNGERRALFEDLVPAGTTLQLPSGELEIAGVTEWGRFRVTENHSAPFFAASIVVGLVGVSLRLLWPRTEAIIVAGPKGEPRLDIRQDVYGTSTRVRDRVSRRWAAECERETDTAEEP